MLNPFSDFVTFFASVSRFYIPVILFATLFNALWSTQDSSARRTSYHLTCSVITGVLVGFIVTRIAISTEYFTELDAILVSGIFITAILAIIGSLINSGALSRFSLWMSLPFVLFTAIQASTKYFVFLNDEALSVTSVVNTGLILNGGALLMGTFAIVSLASILSHYFKRQNPIFCRIIFYSLLLFYSVRWAATLLISLIRLEIAPATGSTISFVAKVQDSTYYYNYSIFLLLLIVLGLFYLKRERGMYGDASALPEPERRKLKKLKIIDKRYLYCGIALLVILVSFQGGYDLVVNQPPQLSEAIKVTPNDEGLIIISTEGLDDGKLHRFSYITSDGYRVRFFIIQRYENSTKYGVVYDACQICGDMGYVEDNRNVICLACNVSIFIPSIGKPGGCNPIPLNHVKTDTEISINATELEAGATYFSERIEIMVQDPVTKKEISNLKSPFRQTYMGYKFCFESAESMDKFVQSPGEYTKDLKKRYFHVEGYKE